MKFVIEHKDSGSNARCGKIETSHGEVSTPAFMPVGTQATVKSISSQELSDMGSEMFISNAYHLYMRPGAEIIQKAGGLHKFMNWNGPILTDSGGYQIFSLAGIRKLKDDGVEFQSHLNGEKIFLTPEKAIEIQMKLDSDIIMVLDECPAADKDKKYVEKSLELTTKWAKRCKTFHATRNTQHATQLFGIVQGGMHADLRKQSAKELVEIGFDGYAIGGLSVGEDKDMMQDMTEATIPHLPEDFSRYLMGVGTPEDLVEGVYRGVDMFDCVMPTRNAR
ncbi:MAG: tRNA guanosine(34) transglycosylase Tgt, partial [Candidatus Omnitrophica bacterium]|nr:tRNA guanosine(34) transglycosylase Tgt [Candidatus Omnitrophota bacterium]